MAYDKPLKGVHRPEGTKGQAEHNKSRFNDTRQHAYALMRSLPKTASKLQGSHAAAKQHIRGDGLQKTTLANRSNALNHKQISNQPQHDGQRAMVEAKVKAHQLSQLTSNIKSAPIKEGNTPQVLTSNQVAKPLTPKPSEQVRANILNSVATRESFVPKNSEAVKFQLRKVLEGRVDKPKADVKEGKDSNPGALAQKAQSKSDPETIKDVSKFVAGGGKVVVTKDSQKQEARKPDGIHKDSTVASTGRSDGKLPIARKEELSSETGGNGSDLSNKEGEKVTQKNFVWKTLSGVGKLASAGLAAVGKRLSGLISGGVNVVRTIATKFLPYKGKHGFGIGASERGLKDVKYADMLAGPGNNIDGGMNG